MAALSQSIRRKLSLLKLAEELGNVSKACQIMGYHRDSFYEIRRSFQQGGVSALVEESEGGEPRTPTAFRPRSRRASSLRSSRRMKRSGWPTNCGCRA